MDVDRLPEFARRDERPVGNREPPLHPGRQHGSLEDCRSAAARPHLRHMQRRIAGVPQLDNPLADIPRHHLAEGDFCLKG